MKECCEQEENQNIKFGWGSNSSFSEGEIKPLYVYCILCGEIVKDLEVGGNSSYEKL